MWVEYTLKALQIWKKQNKIKRKETKKDNSLEHASLNFRNMINVLVVAWPNT